MLLAVGLVPWAGYAILGTWSATELGAAAALVLFAAWQLVRPG